MWEGAARWSTQLRTGYWVATGLSRWMGCSDPQGPGRGRESINPAKMKLCPGCHNPFASSKLYKLFAVFFCIWMMVDLVLLGSNLERCCLRISLFARSDMWEYWERRAVRAKQKKTSSNEKTKTQSTQTNNKTRKPNHKYANKQNNQNLGKQTQPTCVNNGSMYNRVKSM